MCVCIVYLLNIYLLDKKQYIVIYVRYNFISRHNFKILFSLDQSIIKKQDVRNSIILFYRKEIYVKLKQYWKMTIPVIMSENILWIYYIFALFRKYLSVLKNRLIPGTKNSLSITDKLGMHLDCLMLAYSPEVPAATIMADTNDDLVIFLRCAASFPPRVLSATLLFTMISFRFRWLQAEMRRRLIRLVMPTTILTRVHISRTLLTRK